MKTGIAGPATSRISPAAQAVAKAQASTAAGSTTTCICAST